MSETRNYKLSVLVDASAAWHKLCAVPKPVALAYKTGVVYSALVPVLRSIDTRQRELIRRVGIPQKDAATGNVVDWLVPPGTPQRVAFDAEMNELLEMEEALPVAACTFAELIEGLEKVKLPDGQVVTLTDDIIMHCPQFFSEPKRA